MVFNPCNKAKVVRECFPVLTLDGCNLKFVEQFKYLGHLISYSFSGDLDINTEIKALFRITNLLCRQNLAWTLKEVGYRNLHRICTRWDFINMGEWTYGVRCHINFTWFGSLCDVRPALPANSNTTDHRGWQFAAPTSIAFTVWCEIRRMTVNLSYYALPCQISRQSLHCVALSWSPYGIGQTIVFSSCGFFYLLHSSFFLT